MGWSDTVSCWDGETGQAIYSFFHGQMHFFFAKYTAKSRGAKDVWSGMDGKA